MAQEDAVAYIYMNVGVEIIPPTPDAVSYLYMNVGVLLAPPSAEAVSYIYLNVDEAAEAIPHIWSVTPSSGPPGTEVTIIGMGFFGDGNADGADTRVYYGAPPDWDGETPLPASHEMEVIVLPTVTVASANAYNDLRSIPAEGTPNVEHHTVVARVPIPAATGDIRVGVEV